MIILILIDCSAYIDKQTRGKYEQPMKNLGELYFDNKLIEFLNIFYFGCTFTIMTRTLFYPLDVVLGDFILNNHRDQFIYLHLFSLLYMTTITIFNLQYLQTFICLFVSFSGEQIEYLYFKNATKL